MKNIYFLMMFMAFWFLYNFVDNFVVSLISSIGLCGIAGYAISSIPEKQKKGENKNE